MTGDPPGAVPPGPVQDQAAPRLTVHPGRLAWSVPPGWRALSSASVGGGLVRPGWVLNVDVGGDFTRTDLEAYAAEVAGDLGLAGPGCTLLTAADVTQVEHAHAGGVEAWATVGVTRPTWPVRPGRRHPPAAGPPDPPAPGTINIVVSLPAPLSAAALVQAVGTATEAKAQVLVQAGVPGTGTASDALVILTPATADRVPFAGVRSSWGERVARAVHAAVAAGLATHPWPGGDVDPREAW